MKKTAAAILLILSALLCAFTAAAEDEPLFYVSPDGEWTAQAITLTEVKKENYLFLPGNTDKGSLKIGLKNGTGATLNGAPVTGEETAADLKEKNTLSAGGRSIRFTVMQGSPDLPALYITTDTGSMKKIDGSKKYKETGWLVMTGGSGGTEYDGSLEHMKLRGNASTRYTKKNYQIKLADSTDLLGMGKAKKWILTGNWLDESFIRNEMTYDLAEYIGLPYTPERQQAELYVNHEYLGLYLFSEKIEIRKSRVNIADLEEATELLNPEKLSAYRPATKKVSANAFYKAYSIPENPEDITGGYIVEYEFQKSRYETEPSYYRTKRKRGLIIKSPEYASVEQMQYISNFMQGFENAICAADGVDPDTGKHYSDFVDMDSLVRKYMINEFSQNYDGNSSSEFFFKPSDNQSTKAFAGPVWDLDNSYADFAQNYNKKQILSAGYLFIGEAGKGLYWWPNLYGHEDFRKEIRRAYNAVFGRGVRIILGTEEDPDGVLKSLDQYAAAIESSVAMNLARYPDLFAERGGVQTGKSFRENIEYLRTFIQGRTAYLEEAWGTGLPEEPAPEEQIPDESWVVRDD